MRKTLLSIFMITSYINAQIVLDSNFILDETANNVQSAFYQFTEQGIKDKEENCKKEYKILYERNSKQIKEAKEENIKLKNIIHSNNIQYREVKINHLKIRENSGCSIKYWDYFKSTNHEINKIKEENREIKRILTKRNMNYAPLLKIKLNKNYKNETAINTNQRSKAKEELKKQMMMTN